MASSGGRDNGQGREQLPRPPGEASAGAAPRQEAIRFTIERQRHAGFVGRDRLLARIDQLLVANRTDTVRACAVTPDGRHVISASDDKTLKVWALPTGRAAATLAGHTSYVTACMVTRDGRHVVSASADQTLKVWDLATYACRFYPSRRCPYLAVAVAATAVVAGDAAGVVWFLDVPRSLASSVEESRTTPDELLTRPSKLLPSQFEEVRRAGRRRRS